MTLGSAKPSTAGTPDCPFCGAEVDPTGWLRGDGVRGPECSDCGATAPSMEAWSARVLDQSLLARKDELIAFLHGEVTRFESIFKPTNLMLLRGGETMLELCAPDGKFVGVSWEDMRAVLAAMVAVSPIGSGRVHPTAEEERGYRCAELEGLIRRFANFDVQNPDHDDWQYLLSQASLQLSDLSESASVEPTAAAEREHGIPGTSFQALNAKANAGDL